MAKRKTASGKKGTKPKTDRAKAAKPVRAKRAAQGRKPVTETAASTPNKKKSTARSASAAGSPKKSQAKKSRVKEAKEAGKRSKASAGKTALQSSSKAAGTKATVKKAGTKVSAARRSSAKATKSAGAEAAKVPAPPAAAVTAVANSGNKPGKKLSVGPSGQDTPAADKARKLSRPPANSRSAGNGQVAGVLQAARSVASRTTKLVEVGKERKSHLTPEELAEFRQILLDKRRELVEDMVNLEDEARRSSGGSSSPVMPLHMADLGSDTWEQEFTLGLIEKERTIVREIDEALDRIESKTFGKCLATGKPISKARLRVKPWAKYCIEYARRRELGLA